MGAGGDHAAPQPPGGLPHAGPQALQLGPDLLERGAHRRPRLDLGQVELGLDLVAQSLLGQRQDVIGNRPQRTRLGVDEAELLLDAEGDLAGVYFRRSDAPVLQPTQRVASGTTSRRAFGMGLPHASHIP